MCFSPDGSTVVGGLMNGQVYFYNYVELKYITQMNCRNRRGKFKKGTKVTGLSFLKNENEGAMLHNSYPFNTLPPLLVTTNDNRLRLFSLGDYSLRMKYKGLKNTHMQIKANFSDDGKYIICGSEMGGIVVWETQPPESTSSFSFLFSESKDRNCSCESITNNSAVSDEKSREAEEKQENKDKQGNMSGIIGQRNNKRIQSVFQSFSGSKNGKSKTGKKGSGYAGFATVECVAATTAAIFAPVSAILHCAQSGAPGDTSPCSNSSMKSNVQSDSSGTYAPISPDLLKQVGNPKKSNYKNDKNDRTDKNDRNDRNDKNDRNIAPANGRHSHNGINGKNDIADKNDYKDIDNKIGKIEKVPNNSTITNTKQTNQAQQTQQTQQTQQSQQIQQSKQSNQIIIEKRPVFSSSTAVETYPSPSTDSSGPQRRTSLTDLKIDIESVTKNNENRNKENRNHGDHNNGNHGNNENNYYQRSLTPESVRTDDYAKNPHFSDKSPKHSPVSDLSSRIVVATDILGYIRVFVRTGDADDKKEKALVSGAKKKKL